MIKHVATPCGCSYKSCQDWHVEPLASMSGVKFSKEQAEFVAAALNAFDDPRNVSKYLAMIRLWAHQATTKSIPSSSQSPMPLG